MGKRYFEGLLVFSQKKKKKNLSASGTLVWDLLSRKDVFCGYQATPVIYYFPPVDSSSFRQLLRVRANHFLQLSFPHLLRSNTSGANSHLSPPFPCVSSSRPLVSSFLLHCSPSPCLPADAVGFCCHVTCVLGVIQCLLVCMCLLLFL